MLSHSCGKLALSTLFFALSLPSTSIAKSHSAVLPLTATDYGASYNVEIKVGDETFPVIVDTGSADLWVLDADWKCYRGSETTSGAKVPQGRCLYGNKTYTQSSTFEPITNAWLGEHYGAGIVSGPLGNENVQLGGIIIEHQEMGFVNASTATGNGACSGLMGLGYPVLGFVHPANYTASTFPQLLGDRLLYDTVFVRMMKQGVEPFFALALERTPLGKETDFGGYLSFGTLPPVAHGEWLSTPVEVTKTIPLLYTNGTRQISEWTLAVSALSWGGNSSATPFQAVVDSGNGQNFFPEELAAGINAAFDPPATKNPNNPGQYLVPCNATPPSCFGIQIAGTMFKVNSSDMIFQNPDGSCYSTIGATIPVDGVALHILGDAFLTNVVAVFDVGKTEMRFAPRTEGGGSNSSTTGGPTPSATPSANAASTPVAHLVALAIASVFAISRIY